MTRINTNVSSLNAQTSLARSNASLQEALTRLSTGLRINSGKDDPAGLIASEVLRSNIVSVQRAVTNSQRAGQMIATADGALGQVSSLLNDIRGLVSEAANSGVMSQEQIAANQLQVDSSLEAIDRIATITQFQGRRLLDGNLDFVTSDVDSTKISNLAIDQANFGGQEEIAVAANIVVQATRGRLNYAFGAISQDVVLEVGGKEGYEAFSFAAGSTIEDMAEAINLASDALGVFAEVESGATAGQITVSSYGANSDLVLTAKTPGEQAGNYRVRFVGDRLGGALGVSYTDPTSSEPGTITVNLQTQLWQAANATIDDGSDVNNGLVITSKLNGEQFNGVKIIADGTGTAGNESVSYDHDSGELTLTFQSGVSSAAQLIAGFTADVRVSQLFSITNMPDSDGSGTLDASDPAWTNASLDGGVDGGTAVSTANEVISAINNTAGLSDALGAALTAGNDGYGVVSPFGEYAFYGDAAGNDRLQFLAPDGTPNIRFVSSPSQSLGIDLSTDPKVEEFSSAVVQGSAANTTIVLTARSKGAEYDGVTIQYHDTGAPGQDAVVWNPEEKTVDVYIQKGVATADTVVNLINNDDYVNGMFGAENFGSSTGGGTIADDDFDVALATTAGGVSDEGTILVNLATDEDGIVTTTAQDLIDFFDDSDNEDVLASLGISVSNVEGSDGSGLLAPTTEDIAFVTSGTDMQDESATATLAAVNGFDAQIAITALEAGPQYGGVTVVLENTAPAAGEETASYDPVLKVLTIGIKEGATTANDVIAAVNDPANAVSELFLAANAVNAAAATSSGAGLVTDSDGGVLSAGVGDAGTQDGAALLGNADDADTGLSFLAVDYGSEAFVSVKAISGGTFPVTDPEGDVAERNAGTDIDARVNGIRAIGRGLQATVNTSTLDMTFSVFSTVEDGDWLAFRVVGGGAQFQLGPDVVSNQQARLGVASVNTAKLGGVAGRLFELRSGGTMSLTADVTGAAHVVEEAATQITTLRGRLGAFQRTTLETNINALNDTLESLTDAESSIRDADFATETSRLTRAQILVQSGISVLSIANSSPQNVLALLRNQ